MARVLRRHPRLATFVLRIAALVVAFAVLDQLAPDLGRVPRIIAAALASLVVGALVERWLAPDRAADQPPDPGR